MALRTSATPGLAVQLSNVKAIEHDPAVPAAATRCFHGQTDGAVSQALDHRIGGESLVELDGIAEGLSFVVAGPDRDVVAAELAFTARSGKQNSTAIVPNLPPSAGIRWRTVCRTIRRSNLGYRDTTSIRRIHTFCRGSTA